MTESTARRSHAWPTRAARAAIAVIAFALTVWLEWYAPPGAGGEWLRDTFIRLRADDLPEQRFVVVDVDESSLATLGPWPWPRDRLAALVEELLGPYEARGVALDLVMPEPGEQAGDTRLAMLAAHGPLVLPFAFDFGGTLPLRIGHLSGGKLAPLGEAVPATGYIANHKGLAGARHTANIGLIPDRDGMVRRLPMQTWYAGHRYPTLSLALLECCGTPPAGRLAVRGATGAVGDGDGLRRVQYSRAWESYTVIPAAALLARQVPPELVAGKLALVGSSALGLADRVATPLSPNTAGLLVHAAALSSLLDQRDGTAPGPWPGRWLAALYAAAVALLAAVSFPRFSAVANVALLAGASALWLVLAYAIAPHDARFVPAAPLLSNLFLLAVGVPFAWQMTQRQSDKLLGTLRQYVAGSVVDELLRRNLTDPLAPARRDVTTLIADMQGYTMHVAALPVEDAAALTRDFLDCLTRPVLAHGGTLDKYTGDGLVAFWGAPLPIADHADLALDAAAAILREVAAFNAQRAARGLAPVRVRVGMESGLAMAGDFGTSARSIYTAVGDAVNVASRLESAARDVPYDLVVGPGTASRVKRHELIRIGETILRGKESPTTLYTLAPMPSLPL